MNYDENLLVELIVDADLTHGEIAEKVGISRQTVWSIASGMSRPDIQKKIAIVSEGYRQAAQRLAAKHMTALLEKQIEVALEGDGETSRKAREFLLNKFMITLPEQAAKAEKAQAEAEEKREKAKAQTETPEVLLKRYMPGLSHFSEELQANIIKELGIEDLAALDEKGVQPSDFCYHSQPGASSQFTAGDLLATPAATFATEGAKNTKNGEDSHGHSGRQRTQESESTKVGDGHGNGVFTTEGTDM